MEEKWKYIKGYENKYIVSNTGKVVSLNYNNTGKPKELKQKLNKYGYYEVKLSINNKAKDYMVGRLVAEHFIPNPHCKPKVIHIGDTKDNSVNNLMWVYESEAMHHYYNKSARKGTPSFFRITYNGKKYNNYMDIAKDLGFKYKAFYKRYYELKWGLYEALEVPNGKEIRDE